MAPMDAPLKGFYDQRLVALSVVIAICASYAALDLAGRVTAARGRARLAWLVGGATAMGLGIWSMHYIGMLAFSLPVPVAYDWPTVLVSLLAAIFASAHRAFCGEPHQHGPVERRRRKHRHGQPASPPCTTSAWKRCACRRCASIPFRIVALSVALAIVISFVALWLVFLSRRQTKAVGWRKVASALVMGAAIPVMHYTGMAAASFTPSNMVPDFRTR